MLKFPPSLIPLIQHMGVAICLMATSALLVGCATDTSRGQSDYKVDATTAWQKLDTVAYRGKQDDISFIDANTGWYGNGAGKIYRTRDGGATWKEQLDRPGTFVRTIGMVDAKRGFMGNVGTDYYPGVTDTTPLYETRDGGVTWKKVYQSNRPFELTWKASFPTRDIGYVTIQSYNPDQAVSKRVVAKTTDGGNTWREIDLVDDFAVREFGIAFATENLGWVGTTTSGFQTTDGGATWTRVNMGRAVNKIRLIPSADGLVGYAIGVDVHKLILLRPNRNAN